MRTILATKNVLFALLALVVSATVTGCIFLTSFTQPSSANANTSFSTTMEVKFDQYWEIGASYMAVGVLVPVTWDESQIKMTYSNFNINPSNGTMVPVTAADKPIDYQNLSWPDAFRDKLGIGPNYLADLKWVVFRTVETYVPGTGGSVTGRVTITANVGPQNMNVKLGYAVAVSRQTFRGSDNTKFIGYSFSSVFSVVNGEDPLLDYTVPQITSAQPIKALDNDIITLNYDEAAINTALTGATSVYLCAKAFTTNGDQISVCEQTDKTRLTELGGKKFRIDLWPRSFFKLTDGQQLDHIEYYYTDATGTIKVLNNGYSGSPFIYKFSCQ